MLDFGDKVETHLIEGKHGRSAVSAFLSNNMCGYVVGKEGDDAYYVRLEPNGNVLMFNEDELEVIKQMDNQKEEINMQKTNVSNAVEHPSYYQGKIEVIDFIEDKGLGFNLGNSIKYIARAGKKNPEKLLEDLKKARWYLDREIKNIEKKEG